MTRELRIVEQQTYFEVQVKSWGILFPQWNIVNDRGYDFDRYSMSHGNTTFETLEEAQKVAQIYREREAFKPTIHKVDAPSANTDKSSGEE